MVHDPWRSYHQTNRQVYLFKFIGHVVPVSINRLQGFASEDCAAISGNERGFLHPLTAKGREGHEEEKCEYIPGHNIFV